MGYLQRHEDLIKKLDESVKENFGYCSKDSHKILDDLDELEKKMKKQGEQFISYSDRK